MERLRLADAQPLPAYGLFRHNRAKSLDAARSLLGVIAQDTLVKVQHSRDLISALMEGLRPSTSSSRSFSPVYGFCSGGMDGVVNYGQLLLVVGKDPSCLLTNYLASESCLWERSSMYVSQNETPEAIVVALLSSISGADWKELAAHRVDPHGYGSVHTAALDLLHAPLCFATVRDVSSLERIVMAAKKRLGVRNLFVDDVALLRLDAKREPAEGDLPHVCYELQALARRAQVAVFGELHSMDLRKASSLGDFAIRLEDLGDGMARLGIQRQGESKPRFHLAQLDNVCGRIEKIRRSPWEQWSKRFEMALKAASPSTTR
jgi:hypothetical protein